MVLTYLVSGCLLLPLVVRAVVMLLLVIFVLNVYVACLLGLFSFGIVVFSFVLCLFSV